jgi:hypothetical protein
VHRALQLVADFFGPVFVAALGRFRRGKLPVASRFDPTVLGNQDAGRRQFQDAPEDGLRCGNIAEPQILLNGLAGQLQPPVLDSEDRLRLG